MLKCLKLLCQTKTRNQGKKKIQKNKLYIAKNEKKKLKEEIFDKEIKKGGKKINTKIS